MSGHIQLCPDRLLLFSCIYTSLLFLLLWHAHLPPPPPRVSFHVSVDSNSSCCAPSHLSSPHPVLISHFHLLFISFFIWASPPPRPTPPLSFYPLILPLMTSSLVFTCTQKARLRHTHTRVVFVCVSAFGKSPGNWQPASVSETNSAFKTRPPPTRPANREVGNHFRVSKFMWFKEAPDNYTPRRHTESKGTKRRDSLSF